MIITDVGLMEKIWPITTSLLLLVLLVIGILKITGCHAPKQGTNKK